MQAETSEPILRSRLDALEENLERISNPNAIRRGFVLGFAAEFLIEFTRRFNKDFWNQFERRLMAQVSEKLDGVRGIRALLDQLDRVEGEDNPDSKARVLADAWADYQRTRKQLNFDALDETVDAQAPAAKAVQASDRAGDAQSPLTKAAALQIAWGDYLLLREQCQEIFLEFHDVIAGLVYREKNFEVGAGRSFDPTIFYAADELVTFCAEGILTSPSLTVPSPREALARTFGRIVRMRYSEWTVWSLPLIAHEFGHVVLSESDYSEIAKIFDERDLRCRLANLNLAMCDPLNSGADASTKRPVHGLDRKRVETELRYFLADAWGTWVIGPAYACAAIHQRLNPMHVSTLDTVDSFDHERAEVIFGVLRKMGQKGFARDDFPTPQFEKLVKDLREVWDGMVNRANPAGTADPALRAQRIRDRSECLNDIVELICREFNSNKNKFIKLLLYTRAGGTTLPEGWRAAREWCVKWIGALDEGGGEPLPQIEVNGFSNIRDALNAGWQCRMARYPSEVKRIEGALRQLCGDIFKWRLSDPGGGHPGPIR
jgi:hypothetical protein